MPLEILHGALVLFRGLARIKGAKIPSSIGARIDLAGIEPIFAGFELAYHVAVLATGEPPFRLHQNSS